MVAVMLIGIGATLWLWPHPHLTTQVGPKLPTVSAPPNPTATTQPTPVGATGAASRPMAAATSRPTSAPATNITAAAAATTRSAGRPHPVSTTAALPGRTAATDPALTAEPTHARPTPPPAAPTTPPPTVAVTVTAAEPPRAAATPAVITVPFASSNHPNGVQMAVIPHGPSSNGAVWIPGPEEGINNWTNDVSWLNTPGYATPFSTHGAVIIAGHINWQGTPGALSDLAEYGENDIGKTFTVTMTDGRIRTYRITQGFTIDKAQLAAESNQGPLHTTIFGQTGAYGPPEHPTEELRLISCGGQYDPAARSYNSNIIIIARPLR